MAERGYPPGMKTFLLLACLALIARTKAAELNILWIGNSYTAPVWQLVGDVVTKSGGVKVKAEALTPGGCMWARHFGDGNTEAVQKIRQGKFHYVILQDQSQAAFALKDEMKTCGAKFVQEIRAAGAEPIFYCTWAGDPKTEAGKQRWPQAPITQAYWDLAQEHKALFAPVGPAWELALKTQPKLKLHVNDGSHPNSEGRYLTMCVFYALLTGKSPVGLPPQAGVAPAMVKPLQDAAWKTQQEWRKKMQDAGIKLPR